MGRSIGRFFFLKKGIRDTYWRGDEFILFLNNLLREKWMFIPTIVTKYGRLKQMRYEIAYVFVGL